MFIERESLETLDSLSSSENNSLLLRNNMKTHFLACLAKMCLFFYLLCSKNGSITSCKHLQRLPARFDRNSDLDGEGTAHAPTATSFGTRTPLMTLQSSTDVSASHLAEQLKGSLRSN